MRTFIGLTFLLLIVAPTRAEDKGLADYTGTYTIVRGEEGGKDVSEAHLNATVRITKEEFQLFDDQDEEQYAISYEVTNEKQPHKLQMKIVRSTMADAVGSTASGMIKKDGDTVTVLYAYGDSPLPEDFKTKSPGQHLFVLKPKGEK